MFSDKSKNLLCKMRINPDEYYQYLVSKFGVAANTFCKLIERFDSSDKVGDSSIFISFCKEESIESESELQNWLYEFYNNLSRYFDYGVFILFKKKQAEWGAPRINIQKQDVPVTSDIHSLSDPQIIYRGLKEEEHKSQNYAQSWTIDIKKAYEFANGIYSDEPPGIVVQTKISRDNIIYFDADDSEKETIIELGSVVTAIKI